MRVLEAINFTHELDLLEAHLDEHQHFIDKIVVAESTVTYSGMSKPLLFADNKSRFNKYPVTHEVVPASLFIPIPPKYGEEDRKKWFDARRINRERQVAYLFNKYKVECDYVCSADVDEIWFRDSWFLAHEMMEEDNNYIVPKVKVFFHYLDAVTRIQDHWRIASSKMDSPVRKKGIKRGSTEKEIGWHFTSCYKDPWDMWMKGVGIAQSMGYLGWAEVPKPEVLEEDMRYGNTPFAREKLNPYRVMSKEDLSWLPEWMQKNHTLFPWLPEEIRKGREISNWKL